MKTCHRGIAKIAVSILLPCALLWPGASQGDEAMGDPLGKKVRVTVSRPVFQKKTGTYLARFTLTNKTKGKAKETFQGALALFVTEVSRADVSLANASGHTSAGLAYLTVPLPPGGLKPGRRVRGILQFHGPHPGKFKAQYAVYAGVASAQNFATNSGAFGVLALNNARIVFLPVGKAIVPTLLESNGITIASAERMSGAAAANTASVPLSFSADACTVDAAAAKVVCVGFGSTKIAVLDLASFISSLTVSSIKVTEFDSGAPDVALSFSGGSCVLCGVAADPGDRRFIVAANDGYRVYTYAALTPSATPTYAIPVNENFSYDSARNRIIAAEYESQGSARALNVVDLNKGKVYRWTKSTDSCSDLGSSDPYCQAAYAEVDSSAVDLSTGIVALVFEHSKAIALIDLGQAVFDDGTGTFTAPSYYATSPAAPDQSGATASTTGNYLFTIEELGDSHAGVLQLPAVSGSGGAFPALAPNSVYVDLAAIPNPECAGSGSTSYAFSTKGDPHGLALFTGLVGGKQTGLVIDQSDRCAALVDLAGLLATPRDPADATRVAPTADLRAGNVIRFVQLQ